MAAMPQSFMPDSHAVPAAADPARPATPICICVDDFGLHPAINQAVLDLALHQRISATSAMTHGAAWSEGAALLRELGPPALEVGLHLDFTEPQISTGQVRASLSRMIVASHLHRLDLARLRGDIEAQLDAFEARLKRPPSFVDGHQHVHQLPQVRDVLLQTLAVRYPEPGHRPWLRCTWPRDGLLGSVRRTPKAAVIGLLGARALARQAYRRGFMLNDALLGVYDFSGDAGHYRTLLRHWLDSAGTGDVLMCHPAAGDVPGDAIARARRVEFEVLDSPWFGDLLGQAGRRPGPLRESGTPNHGRTAQPR